MQSRKDTAWKKSRKFGDVKGGRKWPKRADNIVWRAHSVGRPGVGAELPIFVNDNASRDFFFPISEEDVRRELANLPDADWEGVTHIWFRRFNKSEYQAGELPMAEFCCGSGVRLITLYPWPRNMEWNHGQKKPSVRLRKILERYHAALSFGDDRWVSRWTEQGLRHFYIEHLLFHEIGHHVDWYNRHWSKANRRILEEAADQYAFSMTTTRSITYKAEGMDANLPIANQPPSNTTH